MNALLVFPYVMVVVPLAARIAVRASGELGRESTILDTFPLLAEYLLPRVGWIIVLPILLVVRNLQIEPARAPRLALWGFLALHAGFLAWAVAGWAGLHGGVLPGGPP